MNKRPRAGRRGSPPVPRDQDLQTASTSVPNSVYAPEALYRSRRIYSRRKQYTKAFEISNKSSVAIRTTKRFNEIIGEQYRIASALLDGARNRCLGLAPRLHQPRQGHRVLRIRSSWPTRPTATTPRSR
jgi:outer membrane protein assembly factor BamD